MKLIHVPRDLDLKGKKMAGNKGERVGTGQDPYHSHRLNWEWNKTS
jgi:hypothetical protein